MVDRYSAGASVSGYLGRPVWYPERNGFGSYCTWWPQQRDLDVQELSRALQRSGLSHFVLFARSEAVGETLRKNGFHVTLLRKFTGGLITNEDHVLFLVEAGERSLPLRS